MERLHFWLECKTGLRITNFQIYSIGIVIILIFVLLILLVMPDSINTTVGVDVDADKLRPDNIK